MRDGNIRTAFVLTLTTGMLLSGSTLSFAANVKYKADMKGSSEVPPTDSAGTGKAAVIYDTKSKKLSWVVTYSGLSGEPTAAHFHGPAARGKNAGPVVDISGNINKGTAELTPEQAKDLQSGKWYVNIHTEKFPDGEIRGQVVK
jgi:CHRD domain